MSTFFANNRRIVISFFHNFGISPWTSNSKGMIATPISFISVLVENDWMITTPYLTIKDAKGYLRIVAWIIGINLMVVNRVEYYTNFKDALEKVWIAFASFCNVLKATNCMIWTRNVNVGAIITKYFAMD